MDSLNDRPLRTAEVIAVGSELLGAERLDTNSLYLSRRFSALGIELRFKSVVGDDREDLAAVFRQTLTRSDIVVLTGGLGPTDDDLTRDVVAGVLGLPLEIDSRIVEGIRARFAKRGMTMPDVNLRQAQVPHGAAVLANPNGTAPGLLIRRNAPEARWIVLLPGPPREVQPIFDALADGPLRAEVGSDRLFSASLFVAGRSESHVEEIVQPIYSRWRDETPPITTTILASPGQIELHLTRRDADPERARAALAQATDALAAALGDDVYSTDGRHLEEVVGGLLRARRYTIAAAESCTGGLFMSRLTDVPGSSEYVRGGVVAYANEIKTRLLGVGQDLLDRHGAVSDPVAMAMAEGVRATTGADVAVGITGIAGPGGGSPEKPVGTVAIAVLVPGESPFVRTHTLPGGRAQLKYNFSQTALDRVRRMLS
ncbi:MAG: competence/damage-inducible protein A [Vicinamibacterales bacterium]